MKKFVPFLLMLILTAGCFLQTGCKQQSTAEPAQAVESETQPTEEFKDRVEFVEVPTESEQPVEESVQVAIDMTPEPTTTATAIEMGSAQIPDDLSSMYSQSVLTTSATEAEVILTMAPTQATNAATTAKTTRATDPVGYIPADKWLSQQSLQNVFDNLEAYGDSINMSYSDKLNADNCGTYGIDSCFYTTYFESPDDMVSTLSDCIVFFRNYYGYTKYGYSVTPTGDGQYIVQLYFS